MLEELNKTSALWQYLSAGQRGLLEEGYFLWEDLKTHPDKRLSDYSFLVFPFAKAYEGFLKQFFRDKGFINEYQYQSDHFRIGKVLSPNLEKHLREKSVYHQLKNQPGNGVLAQKLWQVWKKGRNLVFHYFPHNFRALTFEEAEEIISEIVTTMEGAVGSMNKGKSINVTR